METYFYRSLNLSFFTPIKLIIEHLKSVFAHWESIESFPLSSIVEL